MATRIRFNPVTKEVEIEGTEAFVEAHFKKIQEMLSPPQKKVEKAPAAKPARVSKKAKKESVTRPVKKKLKKGDIFNSIVERIKENNKGMTVGALAKDTGFTQQQVRSVIFRAEKQGVIRRAQRGVYTAAGSKGVFGLQHPTASDSPTSPESME